MNNTYNKIYEHTLCVYWLCLIFRLCVRTEFSIQGLCTECGEEANIYENYVRTLTHSQRKRVRVSVGLLLFVLFCRFDAAHFGIFALFLCILFDFTTGRNDEHGVDGERKKINNKHIHMEMRPGRHNLLFDKYSTCLLSLNKNTHLLENLNFWRRKKLQ